MINWHLSSLVLALSAALFLGSVIGEVKQIARRDATVSEVCR